MKHIFYSLIGLMFWQQTNAQVDAGDDVTICESSAVSLLAEVTGVMGTTAYTVASTTWTPEAVAGTSIGLTDDSVSPVQQIGFSFCFFGNTYTQFYIGSNGWIGFTAGQPTAFASQPLPNTATNVPKNCIMGPWQDWHPGTGNNVGNYIKYQTVGTAPNRKLIVTWDNVPMFSCTNNFGKFQIVLFETSNLIRNNIFNKPTCAWSNGNATEGIHNLGGTVAYTVPGRNSSNWTAANESWEYVPNGIVWSQNGTPVGSSTTLNVSPSQTTTYVATVTLCNGTTYSDDVIVNVGSDIDFSNSVVTGTNCSNEIGSISVVAGTSSPGPFIYQWEGLESTASELTNLNDGLYNLSITDESNGCIYETSFEVPVSSTLEISTTDTDITCNGANDGQAMVTATSDFPGFTYSWSDDLQQTTPEITNLTPGLYSVEVTDADGCNETAIVIISEPASLNISFNNTLITCPGGSDGTITATPSGGVGNFSLLWDGNIVGSTLTDLAEGEYSVTLFDGNGCTTAASYLINDPDSISANFIVNAPSCAGIEDGIVAVEGTGGNGPYTYFWPFNNSTANIVDGLTSGSFNVIITDNNACVDSAIVDISPVLELTITPTISLPNCTGEFNGSIQVEVNGGTADYIYQWNDINLQTSSLATGLNAGTYEVLVQDANGCEGQAQIVVDEPLPIDFAIQSNNPSCNAGNDGQIVVNATGGTAPYTIDWVGNQNGFDVQNVSEGFYGFQLSDANGCVIDGTITLVEPAALTGTFLVADALCYQTATGSVQTSITGGVSPFSYVWSQNTSNSNFNNALSAGAQSVIVTDQNDCQLELNFTVGQPAQLNVNITTEPASCDQNDGSATAVASGGTTPYAYEWTANPTTSPNASNIAAGSYSMTLIDSNGCEFTENYTVSEIPVGASFITNTNEGMTPLEVEFINTSTGANTYTWDFGDGSLPVVTTNADPIYHTYTEEGLYNALLYATYNGDCGSIDSLHILAYQVSEIIKVPNVVSPNADGENDTFRVLSLNMQSLTIYIYDRWGKEVGKIESPEGDWNPREHADGIYYYTLVGEGYDLVKYQTEGHVTVVR